MSKKIIFSDELKTEMLEFIGDTYQCTISDICKHFNLSKYSIYNNFERNFLNEKLFKGCKDSTKEKIRLANIGKKQSPETIKRRIDGTMATMSLKTKEEKQKIYKKAQNTKYSKWGGKQEYDAYQYSKSKQTKM